MKKNGFTLIELLVVIGVISVLTSTLIFIIDPVAQIAKARDAQRKSDLAQIQSALELYRSDVGKYPLTLYGVPCPTSSSLENGTVTYMSKIPCDPKSGWQPYSYVSAGSFAYTLTACLQFLPKNVSANCTSSPGLIYSLTNP